jgi:hypothetical protein
LPVLHGGEGVLHAHMLTGFDEGRNRGTDSGDYRCQDG